MDTKQARYEPEPEPRVLLGSLRPDISITAYEEGYLSADAWHSNHSLTLPENPYPPGPWRPFRSWGAGWEDYHAEKGKENRS